MEDGKDIRVIGDLYEFYRRWEDFRPTMLSLAESDRLDASQREILTSMIAIVDRVGPNDLHPEP